jgi:hypothetical protein
MAILSAKQPKDGKTENTKFHNLGKKDQSKRPAAESRSAMSSNQTRSQNGSSPTTKKKVKRAVELVKEKHRMKVVLTNIAPGPGGGRQGLPHGWTIYRGRPERQNSHH